MRKRSVAGSTVTATPAPAKRRAAACRIGPGGRADSLLTWPMAVRPPQLRRSACRQTSSRSRWAASSEKVEVEVDVRGRVPRRGRRCGRSGRGCRGRCRGHRRSRRRRGRAPRRAPHRSPGRRAALPAGRRRSGGRSPRHSRASAGAAPEARQPDARVDLHVGPHAVGALARWPYRACGRPGRRRRPR